MTKFIKISWGLGNGYQKIYTPFFQESGTPIFNCNSNLNKVFEEEKKMNLYNNENYNFDEDEFKRDDNDNSSEDKEQNNIIQIIEKCVRIHNIIKNLYQKKKIEQIDTYHYTFGNLKVELDMDLEKENNLIIVEGENFELWLVKNFAS